VEPWSSFRLEVGEIIEAADGGVFGELHLTARGKGSGAETELRFWGVLWITNAGVTRRQVFLDRAEALEAAGLRE
jgi:hypothetical protein